MKKSNKKTYEIEYEQAPSGNVTFYNYKEPLMEFKGGFGFQGALVFDTESQKIQCHFCGKWFDALGRHLGKEHNMKASEYKALVGLNVSTALVSEPLREKLIAKNHAPRLKNLQNQKGKKRSKEVREKIAKTLREHRAEIQNVINCCPEQLIDRLKNKYIELGHTPSEHDRGCGTGFIQTIRKVFGSMKEACRIAGIPYMPPSQTYKRLNDNLKHSRAKCLEFIEGFIRINSRVPKYSDLSKGMESAIARYGKKELLAEAVKNIGSYKKIEGYRYEHTKESLIYFLKNFEKENHRKPSASDTRRGLIPAVGVYAYYFGSWKNALKETFNA